MRYYIEAFRADGTQILGSLDGHGVLDKHVKALLSGIGRPKWPRVACWRIVRADGRIDSEIANPLAAQ